ncbi:hypothetical protein PVAND_015930 [Polypedilum vanderplanki]|uniref:Uncharacterized protein n=1 Tax=Polypedilum vanderplanki TaxID=319348 RepID=A0A9J6BEN8_POLVA|nr:hypothetical protein PVAND_015930 [Polypedilum vanderplanki]
MESFPESGIPVPVPGRKKPNEHHKRHRHHFHFLPPPPVIIHKQPQQPYYYYQSPAQAPALAPGIIRKLTRTFAINITAIIAGVPRRNFIIIGDDNISLGGRYRGDLFWQNSNEFRKYGYPQYDPITGNLFYPYVENPSLYDQQYLSNGAYLTGQYGPPQYQQNFPIYPSFPLQNSGNDNYQNPSSSASASANGFGNIAEGLTNTGGKLLGDTSASASRAGTVNTAADFQGVFRPGPIKFFYM